MMGGLSLCLAHYYSQSDSYPDAPTTPPNIKTPAPKSNFYMRGRGAGGGGGAGRF